MRFVYWGIGVAEGEALQCQVISPGTQLLQLSLGPRVVRTTDTENANKSSTENALCYDEGIYTPQGIKLID